MNRKKICAEAQRELNKDMEYLIKGKERVRTFILPEGIISAGFSQKMRIEEFQKMFPEHFVVPRPTGGGMVIHGNDVCFGIVKIFKEKTSPLMVDKREIYLKVSQILKEFFKKTCYVKVEVNKNFEKRKQGILCSQIESIGEIRAEGKKLCGMAMRTTDKGYIVQGTINFSQPNYEFFPEKIRENLEKSTVSITELKPDFHLSKEKFAFSLQEIMLDRSRWS